MVNRVPTFRGSVLSSFQASKSPRRVDVPSVEDEGTMLHRNFGIRLPSEVACNDIVDRVCEDERWMEVPQIVSSGGDELSGCARENLLSRSCQNFVLNLWTTFMVNQRNPSACNSSFVLNSLN
jgi:hypothetical protein